MKLFILNCPYTVVYWNVTYTRFTQKLYSKSASLVAQMVKNLPVMQETQIRSLDQENPLEKGMATYSSILPWRIL